LISAPQVWKELNVEENQMQMKTNGDSAGGVGGGGGGSDPISPLLVDGVGGSGLVR
jgi:hypothetical protein